MSRRASTSAPTRDHQLPSRPVKNASPARAGRQRPARRMSAVVAAMDGSPPAFSGRLSPYKVRDLLGEGFALEGIGKKGLWRRRRSVAQLCHLFGEIVGNDLACLLYFDFQERQFVGLLLGVPQNLFRVFRRDDADAVPIPDVSPSASVIR